MYKQLQQQIQQLLPTLQTMRRDFHEYPETGWFEMRTASIIAAKLTALGYQVLLGPQVCYASSRMNVPSKEQLDNHYTWAKEHGADLDFLPYTKDGFTGVIGILHCGDGPVVALRFDMDALDVLEEQSDSHLPYKAHFSSLCQGTMHACAHDGHMAIGLGVATILSQIKDSLSGTIKLIFQPAEEGVRGAKSIVDAGHLDDVDYLMASHILPSSNQHCSLCPGISGTLATTKINADFHGTPAHAGLSPQDGNNALLAAATATLNIHAIPRHGHGSSRINVGILHAGTSRNVICNHAHLELEVRGETEAINQYLEQYALTILQSCATMHNCTVTTEIVGCAPSIHSTPDFTAYIKECCLHHLHLPVTDPCDMGFSEDFACMSQQVISHQKQVCFTGIQVPCNASLHSNHFDFSEEALTLGVSYYTGVLYHLLKG